MPVMAVLFVTSKRNRIRGALHCGAALFLTIPAAFAFDQTAPMVNARYIHTATRLTDGTVLVAGGRADASVSLDTAEIYDPASASWTLTNGRLGTARHGHTATLLPDGEVLVAGGGSGGFLASAEIYDPVSRTWRPTGSLKAERYVHTATLLKSGKVLVVGGFNSNGGLPTAELYNPSTGDWSLTGSPATPRSSHTATLLPDGKVLVTGGFGATNGPDHTSTSELYDPETGTWSATGPLSDARYGHTATLLWDGRVVVAGGFNSQKGYLNTTEVYDPATGAWSSSGPLSAHRFYHTATALPNGKVLLVGGHIPYGSTLASAELYDPTSGTWSGVKSLAASRGDHTATLLMNGAVLVAGGLGGQNGEGPPLASAEFYVPPAGDVGSAANISTRGLVPDSSSVMIAGFIIQGGAQKKVIIRGIGPSLSKSGITSPMQDPTLELHDSNGSIVGSNDDWQSSQAAEISAAQIAPEDPRESAVVATLDSGTYTAQLRGKPGTNGDGFGVGLIEVYDLDPQPSASRLANISTRSLVQAEDNALIGGFIINNKPTNIVIRAIGPSLSARGVAGVLADPSLELHDANGSLLATNDDWRSAEPDEIIATGLAPTDDAESAIRANLSPGTYTAVVRGVNDTTGVGLVEVYALNH